MITWIGPAAVGALNEHLATVDLLFPHADASLPSWLAGVGLPETTWAALEDLADRRAHAAREQQACMAQLSRRLTDAAAHRLSTLRTAQAWARAVDQERALVAALGHAGRSESPGAIHARVMRLHAACWHTWQAWRAFLEDCSAIPDFILPVDLVPPPPSEEDLVAWVQEDAFWSQVQAAGR